MSFVASHSRTENTQTQEALNSPPNIYKHTVLFALAMGTPALNLGWSSSARAFVANRKYISRKYCMQNNEPEFNVWLGRGAMLMLTLGAPGGVRGKNEV